MRAAEPLLPPAPMKRVSFVVYGAPVPKGSHHAFVVGWKPGQEERPRTVTVANNKEGLERWEWAVIAEAQRVAAQEPGLFLAPVVVTIRFSMLRPPSVSQAKRPFPTVDPDLDKLMRSTVDGIQKVIIKNDAQVCGYVTEKRYVDDGPGYAEITVAHWTGSWAEVFQQIVGGA